MSAMDHAPSAASSTVCESTDEIPAHQLAALLCGGPVTSTMVRSLMQTAIDASAYIVLHVGIGGGVSGSRDASVMHVTHTPKVTSTSGAQNRRMKMALCMPCRSPTGDDLTPLQRGTLKAIISEQRVHRNRALLFVECALRSGMPLRYDRTLVLEDRSSAAHLYCFWVALAVRAWSGAHAMRSPLGVNDALISLMKLAPNSKARLAANSLLKALRMPKGGGEQTVTMHIAPPASADELPNLPADSHARTFLAALSRGGASTAVRDGAGRWNATRTRTPPVELRSLESICDYMYAATNTVASTISATWGNGRRRAKIAGFQ